MTTQVKAITLRASYESDLSGFKKDAATIKSFRKQLEKTPIRVPIRLDLSGIKSDATRAATEYKKALGAALAAVPAGGAVSKGGIIIPAGFASEVKEMGAISKGAFKEIRDGADKAIGSYEQLAEGVQRFNAINKRTGKLEPKRIVDTSPVAEFQKRIKQIERDFSSKVGTAKGSGGDVVSVLQQKQKAIRDVLSGNDIAKLPEHTPETKAIKERLKNQFDAVKNLPEYRKAESSLDRLEQRISEGSARNVKGGRVDALKERLASVNEVFTQGIGTAKGTKGDVAAVLQQKRGEIQKALTEFGDLAKDPAFKSARNTITKLDEQIANAQPRQAAAADKASRASRGKELQKRILGIDDATAGNIGRAQGGRVGIEGVLADKRRRIGRALAEFGDIEDSQAFRAAQKSMVNLDKQIVAAGAREQRQQDQKTRKGRTGSLSERLAAIDKDVSGRLGTTQGKRGDVAGILAEKRNRIAGELSKFADIADSAEFKKAQRSINTLNKQIGQAEPTQQRAADNDKRKDANRRAEGFIKRQTRSLDSESVKENKIQETIAKRNLGQVDREAEVNRVLDRRGAILEKQVAQYRKLAEVMKSRGQTEAAGKYTSEANRLQGQVNQLKLDRERGQTKQIREGSDNQLKQRLNSLLQYQKTQNEIFKNEEAAARKSKTMGSRDKEKALADVAQRREQQRLRTMQQVAAVENEAGRRGNRGLQTRAADAGQGLRRQGIADMRRLTAATNASGHAINFHTDSLLRNAATFTKWFVPAQLAMGAFRMFGQGAKSAVDAQRTFKILNAVFRGTREDAALLADQTLALAAANGRSAAEAADAALAWSRMGLTRTQVLIAMEASLRAANVAEIDAAQATAYLTASYKAFGQTIADIPATLDYINSLSNKNPVHPKDIFEGMARSAATARVAGLGERELASIITAVTATTQRPGQEVGNAFNTILTRVRRPRVMNQLKKEFGLDIKDSEGQLKKMKHFLGEVTDYYQSLSDQDPKKPRLADVMAGARQGNRFQIFGDNWTEVLIAQAKAGADANSAMRENAEIIESVSAKLQGLSTSWTRLFHTMGESGVFDALSFGLEGVGNQVESLTRNIRGMADDIGGLFDGGGSGGNSFSRTMAQYGRYRKVGVGFGMSSFMTAKDLVAGRLPESENVSSTQLAATKIGKMVEETTIDQNRVSALDAAEEALRVMAARMGRPGVSKRAGIRQFDELLEVFAELPGGQANVAKTRKEIRPLLEGRDDDASRAALTAKADEVRDFNAKSAAESEGNRIKALKLTTDTIEAARRESERLNDEIAASTDKPQKEQDRLQKEYYESEQFIKGLLDMHKKLENQMNREPPDPFGPQKAIIEDYLADLKMVGKVYGELLAGMGNTGFANLDAKLKLGGARIEENITREMLESTRAENQPLNAKAELAIRAFREFDPPDVADKQEERLRNEIGARNAQESVLEDRLRALREELEPVEREMELQRQAQTLQTGYDDSRRSTAAGFSRFEVGQSEGSRLASRTGGILRELRTDVENPQLGAGDPLQDYRELGAITERMTQAKEGLFSMEERIFRARADQLNLEREISEENRKQNEEASKRLAMASREDQLRAAAAAAVLRSRGKSQFSMEEFQFFTQETKGAIQNFSPRAVKGLDDTEANQNEARRKLDNEISGLAITLRSMRETFDQLRPKAEEKAGGIVDPNKPLGGRSRTAGEVVAADKNEIRMNLNTGPISVSIDFARHVQTIKDALQVSFDTRLTTEMVKLRDSLRTSWDPDMGPVNSAW